MGLYQKNNFLRQFKSCRNIQGYSMNYFRFLYRYKFEDIGVIIFRHTIPRTICRSSIRMEPIIMAFIPAKVYRNYSTQNFYKPCPALVIKKLNWLYTIIAKSLKLNFLKMGHSYSLRVMFITKMPVLPIGYFFPGKLYGFKKILERSWGSL